MDVFDLAAKISLDTSDYEKGLSEAGEKTSGLGSKITGALGNAAKIGATAIAATTAAVTGVSVAMLKGIGDTAAYGDSIDKASQKLGVSAEFYQEWEAVLQHSGTSMDSMSATFKKLATASQDASADQQAAFEQLGLTMEQVSSMSAEDLFTNVISGLQNMEEGTERTALATTLLGKGAMEMGALLNTSAEDTQAMIDTVNQLGGVMSDDAVKAAARYQDSLQDLQTGFSGLKNNLSAEFLPAVADVMDGLTALFSEEEGGTDKISKGIEEMAKKIEENMPKIVEKVNKILPTIVNTIVQGLPTLITCGNQILLTLSNAIIENLPQIIEAVTTIMPTIIDGIITMLPLLIECGLQIMLALANGITEQLPTLIPTVVEVVLTIVENLIENVDLLIDSAIAIIIALAEGLINALPRLIEKAPIIIEKLATAIVTNAPKLLKSALELILMLAKGIVEYFPKVIEKIPALVTNLKQKFIELVQSFTEIGDNIIQGIWRGLQAGWNWLTDRVKDLASSLLNAAKSVLGIASPSKEFAKIGEFCTEGFNEGIEELMDGSAITKSIENAIGSVGAVDIQANIGANQTGIASGQVINQTINVNQEVASADELAQAIRIESRYGLMGGVAFG